MRSCRFPTSRHPLGPPCRPGVGRQVVVDAGRTARCTTTVVSRSCERRMSTPQSARRPRLPLRPRMSLEAPSEACGTRCAGPDGGRRAQHQQDHFFLHHRRVRDPSTGSRALLRAPSTTRCTLNTRRVRLQPEEPTRRAPRVFWMSTVLEPHGPALSHMVAHARACSSMLIPVVKRLSHPLACVYRATGLARGRPVQSQPHRAALQ